MLADFKASRKKSPILSWLVVVVPLAAAATLVWSARHQVARPVVSIFEAARTRDVKDVQLLVQSGTSVNELSTSGHTPLFIAAGNNDQETVEFLLKNGASPNAEQAGKNTALEAAALSGNLAIVTDLLNAGARLDATTRDNETPLHAAAGGGNKDIVELLIKRGSDLNARRTSDHATPIAEAASSGNMACVEALAAHGANLNIPGYRRRTPLILAIIERHYDVAARLVALGADLTKVDGSGASALLYAFFQHQFDLADTMIKKMNDNAVRAYDIGGYNALYYAVATRAPVAIVQELIARGCSPEQKSKVTNLLDVAIRRKDQTIIDLLKKAGAKQSSNLSRSYALGSQS